MEQALRILKETFGHDTFRLGQKEIIRQLLSGADALCIMPTGGGKSICYQVPALLFSGITLVVSPLISLMKDQVNALCQAGVAAAYLNTSLSLTQYNKAVQNMIAGKYKIIYVTPERLGVPDFLRICCSLPISLLAVDEAHCISQWGQDFRPSYLKIIDFINALPRRPAVGAFTATATAIVREDIARILQLKKPLVITTGFDRPNLFFSVIHPQVKSERLLELVEERRDKSGIIYCATRKSVEEVCALLQEEGYAATRYHAGLSEEERRKNQDDFIYDRSPIIVATNAFGMGIDKSNVSYVIHFSLPKSMESYYQEAGRAGRDGTEADCILLYAPRDVRINQYLINNSEPNPELSAEQQALVRAQDSERLKRMTFYCTTADCLRSYILRYFGDRSSGHCGKCSTCLAQTEPAENAPTNSNSDMLKALKQLRRELAQQQGVPAYAVFTDATLEDMCRGCPKTAEALLEVSGVGAYKLKRYGAAFLQVLQQYPASIRHGANRVGIYERWTQAETETLRQEILSGLSVREMARRHKRTQGAITSRIKKNSSLLAIWERRK